MTKAREEDGNGKHKLSAKTMVPLGIAIVFGGYAISVAVGEAVFKEETRHAVKELREENERLRTMIASKLEQRDFTYWVQMFQRDPAKIPEAPR